MAPPTQVAFGIGLTSLPAPPLACTVRGCGEPLGRHNGTFACARGHAYDIARSGYVNVLQPQDRRSRAAGDSREAVAARAELLAAGVGRDIVTAFVRLVSDRVSDGAVVVDLGAGSGEALAALAAARPVTAIGIDLSTAAAAHAARRYAGITWVVANADRRLPLLDGGVDAVMSLHGRRNPAECARVLKANGLLAIAVPAEDDLIELRTSVHGAGAARARGETLIAEHRRRFTLQAHSTARVRHQLDRPALLNVLRGTYRGMRASERESVARLHGLDVTFASDFFVFRRRNI
jgi:23S rRNA (guanine745-N1)-methyltransferase